ncbi:MAG: hypothetical protein AB1481_06590, partial [Candidatus Omnitrophota bacterium]
VSLETSFTPVLENKNDKRRGRAGEGLSGKKVCLPGARGREMFQLYPGDVSCGEREKFRIASNEEPQFIFCLFLTR